MEEALSGSCVDHPDSPPFTGADQEADGLYNDDEFAFVCGNPASPVPADEIFLNGQIKPTYQAFAGDTFTAVDIQPPPPWLDAGEGIRGRRKYSNRTQLKALIMRADREEAADDLEPPPPLESTYCTWNPRDHSAAVTPPERCEKSSSTGSSSMWRCKLKELLLKRSNSVGTKAAAVVVGAREKGGGGGAVEYYVRQRNDRNMKMQRRKSFLPYRQDLVGFFKNVNGLTTNLHPF